MGWGVVESMETFTMCLLSLSSGGHLRIVRGATLQFYLQQQGLHRPAPASSSWPAPGLWAPPASPSCSGLLNPPPTRTHPHFYLPCVSPPAPPPYLRPYTPPPLVFPCMGLHGERGSPPAGAARRRVHRRMPHMCVGPAPPPCTCTGINSEGTTESEMVGTPIGILCIQMEYCEQGSLRQHLSDHPEVLDVPPGLWIATGCRGRCNPTYLLSLFPPLQAADFLPAQTWSVFRVRSVFSG